MRHHFQKKTSFIFLILISSLSFAQNEGSLKIFTKPNTSVIKVDSITLNNTNTIKLSEGLHRVRIWHSKFYLFDTTVTIVADTVTVLIKELLLTKNYREYRSKLKQYKTSKFLLRIPPLFAFSGFSGYAYHSYRKRQIASWAVNKYKEDYDYSKQYDRKVLYENSLDDYELYNERLKKAKMGLASAATLGAVFFLLSTTLEEPIFDEKILLSVLPDQDHFYAGIILKF